MYVEWVNDGKVIVSSKVNSSPKAKWTFNIWVICVGRVERGNPAVFNTFKTLFKCYLWCQAFHSGETQFQKICADFPKRKICPFVFIWQQVHQSCQVTMVSEDPSYLTPTSTTLNLPMTPAPPSCRSPFPVSPPQCRATRPSWTPTSRSPTGSTAPQPWPPTQALCLAPRPCRRSCRRPSPATPLTSCWWVCRCFTVRE